jgi:hypothetical protein
LPPQPSGLLNQVFVDLSGTADRSYLVAAAYVAAPQRWAKHRKAWSGILSDAKARVFHATDFYAGQGEFQHISAGGAEHNAFAARFTNAVVANCGVGVAFGVHVDSFNDIVVPALAEARVPNGGLTPEMLAVSSCLSKLATLVLGELPQFKADVTIEDGPRMGGVVQFIEIQRTVPTNPLVVFQAVRRAPKARPELQAADLLAHEAARHILNEAKEAGRPTRKSFQAMMSTKQLEVGFADRAVLERETPRLVRQVLIHAEFRK